MLHCSIQLYNLCRIKDSALSENTGKRIGIEDESISSDEIIKDYFNGGLGVGERVGKTWGGGMGLCFSPRSQIIHF